MGRETSRLPRPHSAGFSPTHAWWQRGPEQAGTSPGVGAGSGVRGEAGGGEGARRWDLGPRQPSPSGACVRSARKEPERVGHAGQVFPSTGKSKGGGGEGAGLSCSLR